MQQPSIDDHEDIRGIFYIRGYLGNIILWGDVRKFYSDATAVSRESQQ